MLAMTGWPDRQHRVVVPPTSRAHCIDMARAPNADDQETSMFRTFDLKPARGLLARIRARHRRQIPVDAFYWAIAGTDPDEARSS
jgi:hypothetical protein